jgi:hypothetical protein
MKKLACLLLSLVFSMSGSLARAETTLNAETVKKMVVFLFPAFPDGTVDKEHPLGTGFLIAIPFKGAPQTRDANGEVNGKGALLLITARHIVDPNWANCAMPQPRRIYARIDTTNYDPKKGASGVDFEPVDLVELGQKKYLVRDDDDNVDAAVIDVTGKFSQAKYAFTPMTLAFFATAEEAKKLRVGDSIASAGLIPKRSGENRNFPFFKFGNISNIPDEPIWVGCPEDGKLKSELRLERVWFIAVNLIGGNSGSPVFYYPPSVCMLGFLQCNSNIVGRVMVVGVQSSSFDGADVAGMTPIEDVFKIIQDHASPDFDLYRGNGINKPDATKP